MSDKNKKPYYLQGKSFWEDSIKGKRIIVTGIYILKEIEIDREGLPADIPAQLIISGKKPLILYPKWKLIDSQ